MRFLLYLLRKDLLTTTSFSKGIFQICFPLVKFWAFIHTPSLSTHVVSSLFSSKSLTVWFRLPFSESSVRHTILSVQFVCLFSGPLEKKIFWRTVPARLVCFLVENESENLSSTQSTPVGEPSTKISHDRLVLSLNRLSLIALQDARFSDRGKISDESGECCSGVALIMRYQC